MEKNAQASGLSLEVGDKLRGIGKASEAIRFYQRAADLRSGQSSSSLGLEYVQSREKVAACLIDIEDYHSALVTLTEVGTSKVSNVIYLLTPLWSFFLLSRLPT